MKEKFRLQDKEVLKFIDFFFNLVAMKATIVFVWRLGCLLMSNYQQNLSSRMNTDRTIKVNHTKK